MCFDASWSDTLCELTVWTEYKTTWLINLDFVFFYAPVIIEFIVKAGG